MQRRDFIKVGAAAAAAPAFVRAAAAPQKVRMGFIGVGNRGTQLLHLFMRQPDVAVTALCDVYDPYLKRDESAFDPKFLDWGLKGRLPVFKGKDGALLPQEKAILDAVKARSCKLYADYRRLLEDKNVDAVCIATPDHWHALMAIDAIKAGKDVYCEKPLTVTVAEGRALVNAQKASKQVACVGLNRRGSAVYRKLKGETPAFPTSFRTASASVRPASRRRGLTGTSGSARAPSVRTSTRLRRTTSAGTRISRARWATGACITWTCCAG